MIACPECDALQEEPLRLPRKASVSCWRCQAALMRDTGKSIDHTFALTITGCVLFTLANTFPLVGLEAQGNAVTTTLFGAALHLWNQGLQPVALLTFVTTIAAPAFDLFATLFLLVAARRLDAGHAESMPSGAALLLRALQAVGPWGMLEVFMLGALVSIVKLGGMATVVPGVALYSFGALMLVLAAISSAFDARDIWSRIAIRA